MMQFNQLTGQLPSQLAHWTRFSHGFETSYNSLCGDFIPTELDTLLSAENMPLYDDDVFKDWLEGNSLGTPCAVSKPPSTAPTTSFQPTNAPSSSGPTQIPTSQPSLRPSVVPTHDPSPPPTATLLPSPSPTQRNLRVSATLSVGTQGLFASVGIGVVGFCVICAMSGESSDLA